MRYIANDKERESYGNIWIEGDREKEKEKERERDREGKREKHKYI